jgi:hypothetical protein
MLIGKAIKRQILFHYRPRRSSINKKEGSITAPPISVPKN